MKLPTLLSFATTTTLLKELTTPAGLTLKNWWNAQHNNHLLQVDCPRYGSVRATLSCPMVFVGDSTVNMRPSLTAVSIKGEKCIMMPVNNDIFYPDNAFPRMSCGVTAATVLGPLLALGDAMGTIHIFNQDAACIYTGFTERVPLGLGFNVIASPMVMTFYRMADEYLLLCAFRDGLIRKYRVPWSIAHSRSTKQPPIEVPQVNVIKPPYWMKDITLLQSCQGDRLLVGDGQSVCVINIQTAETFFVKRDIKGFRSAHVKENVLVIETAKKLQKVHLGQEMACGL